MKIIKAIKPPNWSPSKAINNANSIRRTKNPNMLLLLFNILLPPFFISTVMVV